MEQVDVLPFVVACDVYVITVLFMAKAFLLCLAWCLDRIIDLLPED